MARALTNDQILGVVLIVLGIVAAAGRLGNLVFTAAAIGLIVLGILILMGRVRGATWIGALCVAGGVVLLIGWFDALRGLVEILTLVVGIVMIVLGVLKLAGK